jgi:SOS response regulatory protein OraA/RecX
MSVITALRASADGRAIRIEKDGAKWLRLPVHLVADLGLSSGQEMDAARVTEIEEAAALERLWEAALRFTVGRGRADREVTQRLRDRRADEGQVATVMARLAAAGLGDEEANADLRVERLATRGWATRRIQSEMMRVGFPSDTVRRALDEGLPAGHDADLLARAVDRSGIPDSAADRTRMANRLMRQGLPPAAVREAVRPTEGARAERAAAPEADELIRQVRRRYPAQGTDSGDRRRALGWLARRGVGPDDSRRILEEAAGGD